MPSLPAPRAPRYESLDLWRGIACLLVLVNHSVFYAVDAAPVGGMATVNWWIATIAARLWIGVPIFFVISGYCISATIDKQRRSALPIREYFYRRVRRIFPPFWIVLVSTAAIVGVVDVAIPNLLTGHGAFLRPWWYSPSQWFGTTTLTEQWRWHLIGGQKAWILGHAWTLGYEEQFYAVTGLLLALCPRQFFAGSAVVTASVALVAGVAALTGAPVEGFFFDGSWIQFAFGVLVYHTLNYASASRRWTAAALLAAVVVGAAAYGDLLAVKNTAMFFAVAAAFSIAILWLRPHDERMITSPWLAPVKACGVMCYSLYLVHLPVANLVKAGLLAAGVEIGVLSPFVSFALCAIPSLAIARVFHLTVERRFMNSARPARVDARPAAAGLPAVVASA